MAAETTLIVGAALPTPGRAPALGPTAIHISAGRIAAIEPVDLDGVDPEMAGLIALPAPTNAHDHGRGLNTVGYGAVDDRLEAWLPTLSREPPTDPYLNAVVAFARMAEGGICAANDCYSTQDRARLFEEAEAVSRAAQDVGIRVAFAVPFMNRNRGVYGDASKLAALLGPEDGAAFLAGIAESQPIEDMLRDVERIAALENPFFKVQYGPVGPQWASDDALIALGRASAETGRRIHMHFFETERQRDWADHAYPDGGLIAFLDGIGFLSPRLTVAHGVWLRPRECDLLAARGVSVAVNLSSNMRLRSGLPPVASFKASGVRFGIGLDASSFDDDGDILREIRLLWRVCRGFADADVLAAGDVFDAALVDGRRTVLGDDGGGRLAVGAPADIMVLDLAAITADFIDVDFDAADVLLTRMAKRHLTRLIVGGRTVVEDAGCVSVDRPAMEARLLESARAARRADPPDAARMSRMQRGIASFYAAGLHKGAAL
jgi:cytosine/adenosine deaminase-related metal-dependent hydrolase